VLRRPQTKADLDPALLQELGQRSISPLAALRTPVRSLIRLAAVTPWGDKVFLVPFKRPSRPQIAKLPARLRRRVARWLARAGHGLKLGLFAGGGGCCDTTAHIEAAGSWISGGPSPNWLVLVVPDGIARVTVSPAPTQADEHPQAITAAVHNNVAAFEVQQPVEDLYIDKMVWYSPSGSIVKRIG
jgi:hypothetical protein